MLFGIHDFLYLFCGCVVAALPFLVLFETPFQIVRYTGVQRTIAALQHVDDVHAEIVTKEKAALERL
jgi:hypothetical protein